ncbi:MAG: DNA recombination protein RmuC [Chloroflexi bacterium]|nr:DNA recombination protein RmuC [Chloroflexota bacterium]
MDTVLLGLLTVLVIVLLAAVFFLLSLQLRRSRQEVQSAILTERLSQLGPVTQAVNNIQLGVAELHAYARARHDLEQRTAESIRRLETIIAGTQTKGAAGENVIDLVFSKLPPEWQVRNFRVGNKTVEFGLRLPNNLVLPIDSKWTSTALVERLAACDDPVEQQRLKAHLEAAVLEKAREVKKYVDPSITVSFGLAAVPDAVYDLTTGIQTQAFQMNVVVISYSMFVPYLLLVFHTTLKSSQSIDVQKLNAHLRGAEDSVKALQEEIEGRFSRAITMLTNSRGEISVHLSRVSTALTNLQVSARSSGSELSAPQSTAAEGAEQECLAPVESTRGVEFPRI